MPVVVKIPEKVKAGGAKGHYCKQASNEQDMDRSEEEQKSTQERVERLVNPSGKKRKDMTRKERVQMLQRKLYLSATQTSNDSTAKALDKGYRESRMRENCTYGLMRGRVSK